LPAAFCSDEADQDWSDARSRSFDVARRVTYETSMWKSIVYLWLFAGLWASALAGTYKVPPDEPLATLKFPDRWQTKEHGEITESASPEGAWKFLVTRPEPSKITESMGEVMRYIRNTGGITVKAESVKRDSGTLNDLDTRSLFWEAKDKNGAVKITITVVSIAKNEPLLLASWGSPAAERKYRAELDKILKSLKKA
jgi:hypothetical protein